MSYQETKVNATKETLFVKDATSTTINCQNPKMWVDGKFHYLKCLKLQVKIFPAVAESIPNKEVVLTNNKSVEETPPIIDEVADTTRLGDREPECEE